MAIPRILSIAGSDSGGGAGIQADIKTITMLGGHAMTAITAITAQNTLGVTQVMPVSAEMVIAQIDACVGDIGVDAVKIGMIGSAEVAEAVADRLREEDIADVPVVFDPVMVATSGFVLTDPQTALHFLRLLSRAAVSTPNLDELAAISGMSVGSEIEIGGAAAHLIEQRGTGSILATGVRLRGGRIEWEEAGQRRSIATDNLLFDFLYSSPSGLEEKSWHDELIATEHDHGTGCTLSTAIATGLGAGMNLPEAITEARKFVRASLLAAPGLGRGHGPMGQGFVTPSTPA